MSENTPTLKEVRDEWMFATQHVDMDGYVITSADEAYAQFDRWLSAEKAKWQAEAVQEVIDFLDVQEGDGGYAHFAARLVQWWQDARAARIEKGSDDGR